MFERSYEKLPILEEKLRKKYDISKLNQAIHIRDILIQSINQENSYGESRPHNNIYQSYDPLQRLLDHIVSLAKIAIVYHQKYYCDKNDDGQYSIKTECINKITRLLLNEFFLYTAKPLTMEEFIRLRRQLEKRLINLPQNVHLLFSSFAVMNQQGEILNIVLYIEGGANIKIHQFCKGRSSRVDIKYEDTINYKQQDEMIGPENITVSPYILGQENVSNNSVFSIELESGATYLQCIDVCLDYAYGHAKKLLIKMLNNSVYIPPFVNHLITANHITLASYPHCQITPRETISHADPQNSQYRLMENDEINKDDLRCIKNYRAMRIFNKQDYKKIMVFNFYDAKLSAPSDILYIIKMRYPENHPYLKKNIYQHGIILPQRGADWLAPYEANKIIQYLALHENFHEKLLSFDAAYSGIIQTISDPILINYLVKLCKYDGIIVQHPPFGSDYRILATEEKQLSGFIPELAIQVKENNMLFFKKHLQAHLSYQPDADNYYSMIDQYELLLKITEAYETLLLSCDSAGMLTTHTLFNNDSEMIKTKAKKIIADSYYHFKELKKKNVEYTIFTINVLLRDLYIKLDHLNSKDKNALMKIDALLKMLEENAKKNNMPT